MLLYYMRPICFYLWRVFFQPPAWVVFYLCKLVVLLTKISVVIVDFELKVQPTQVPRSDKNQLAECLTKCKWTMKKSRKGKLKSWPNNRYNQHSYRRCSLKSLVYCVVLFCFHSGYIFNYEPICFSFPRFQFEVLCRRKLVCSLIFISTRRTHR